MHSACVQPAFGCPLVVVGCNSTPEDVIIHVRFIHSILPVQPLLFNAIVSELVRIAILEVVTINQGVWSGHSALLQAQKPCPLYIPEWHQSKVCGAIRIKVPKQSGICQTFPGIVDIGYCIVYDSALGGATHHAGP